MYSEGGPYAEPVTPWFVTYADNRRSKMGRGILLWLLGVPIPIIILLALIF